MLNKISLRNFEIGGDKLTILAGPCAIESKDILFKTAEFLKTLTNELDINFIFKSSFDKANRTSINSYRGPGIEKGLKLLAEVKKEFDVPIVTDIHESNQAEMAAETADIIQIPAFLCRQTDLLIAAAKTNKIVNIKKGQFLAPAQMKPIAQKVADSGNKKIIITDRGVTFGYNNLVTDMRAIPIIQSMGYPVIFDATHSVQLPGGCGESSSGERKFVPVLAKAAIAAGADGLFFEVHPNPDSALCDGANMINFEQAKKIFKVCNDIFKLLKESSNDF
ncbi:MAG: 3-deoxy-8-phosphooctulonate synthase [Candidatus Gastranaerophilales bacterium]|nr:3-deoxy-8-phosphooctulonate synthase [Candidatus Gastranaerophilales bacterium]